jgi:hypothetical protein
MELSARQWVMRAVALALLVVALGAGPSSVLAVSGAYVHGEMLSVADVAALPHVTIAAVEHGGASAQFSGVSLAALLHAAGAPVGDAVRELAARSYVVVHATDGYVTVFTLAELDPTAATCAPIVADARNGAPLSTQNGAFEVIAPCDKTHARWARNVDALTVVTIPGPLKTSP